MDTTRVLEAHAAGDPHAVSELLPLVYDRLRALASAYMRRERRGHSLCATDLVHEAYLRLVDNSRISWQGKTHFFAIAAKQMRRILVESARARRAEKREGQRKRVTLTDNTALVPGIELEVLALNEALQKLEQLSERQAEVVELRFFGGLNAREAAYVLRVSDRTVKQDWRVARAWLLRELGPAQAN